jgi:hypothetical protein
VFALLDGSEKLVATGETLLSVVHVMTEAAPLTQAEP